MTILGKFQGRQVKQANEPTHLTGIDAFTQKAALTLSRRTFGRMLGIGVVSMAIHVWTGQPAAAISCQYGFIYNGEACECVAPCSHCYSQVGTCCSPNGQYCYSCTCTCQPFCGACVIGFRADIIVYDNGYYNCSCPQSGGC